MRRHRVEYDGALYHVIQRSNNREKIFGSDSDKKLLIDLVTGCSSKLGIKRNSLEEILGSSGASAEDIKLICSGSRKRNLRVYKRIFALKAAEEGYTQKQIGEYIRISDAAVNKLIS